MPTAREWLRNKARDEGIDPETLTLPEAAEFLVSQLERCRREQKPLSDSAVDLASLLVSFCSALASQGAELTWSNAEPLMIQALTRQVARTLEWQYLLTSFRQAIAQPSAEDPLEITLFDLVKTFEDVLAKTRRSAPTLSVEGPG